MARNRKAQSVAIRFGPAVKASLLCLLIGGSGVGYVWQKDQIARLGQQFKAKETRLMSLEKCNEGLRKQLAFLRSVQALEARIKELKLDLTPPQASQIWRLTEPDSSAPVPELAQPLVTRNDHVVALH
jgi:hypothetical protein